MQSLMLLDCFVQKLLKKNLWGFGSTPPLLDKGRVKTHSDQSLTKLINQVGGLLLLFSHRDIPKMLKMTKIPLLEKC